MERDKKFDILKGILIVLVVIAHGGSGTLGNIIYLFHMPLFFIISGYFIKENTHLDKSFAVKKIKRLMLPYAVYMLIDFTVFKLILSYKQISVGYILKRAAIFLWGGRLQIGVYWYTTVLFFSIILFVWITDNLESRKRAFCLILGGGFAVLESNIAEHFTVLKSIGLPMAIDSCLLAVLYIAIGYYGKSKIRNFIGSKKFTYDLCCLGITVLLLLFCIFNYSGGNVLWKLDMKKLLYKEFFLSVLIPILFGIVLLRAVYWLNHLRWLREIAAYIGRMSIPIMYLHMLLNTYHKTIGYGLVLYTFIGVFIPILISRIIAAVFPKSRAYFGI